MYTLYTAKTILNVINISPHRVMKVAKGFLDQGKKMGFAVASRTMFSHDVSELGLDASAGELPVVGIRTAKGDKYVMSEEFT